MFKHIDKWNRKIGNLLENYKNSDNFWIIHDGNGKPHIYEKARTIIDHFRSYFPIKLILILDENRDNPVDTVKKEILSITPRFTGNLWNPLSVDRDDNIVNICFPYKKGIAGFYY